MRAGPEDLQGVTDVGEPVRRRGRVRPPLHAGAVDLDRAAAGAADQVVVVALGAAPVGRIAAGGAQHVDLVRIREGLQAPVDGGQADLLPPPVQQLVQQLALAKM